MFSETRPANLLDLRILGAGRFLDVDSDLTLFDIVRSEGERQWVERGRAGMGGERARGREGDRDARRGMLLTKGSETWFEPDGAR